MPKNITLEICASSAMSALAAQQGGAQRVELCENLVQAGTTPSYGQIAIARKLLDIKLYVLIRPRSGDFLYSDDEFDIMIADVQNCVNLGCDGIVTGILNRDGSIDKKRSGRLVDMARDAGLGATFHRAFDVCSNYSQALEDIIDLGFERVLTSGGQITAIEGMSTINHLVKQSAGRIGIMAGSGVNAHNVADLIRITGVTEVHTSARKQVSSAMAYHNNHITMGNHKNDLYGYDQTDASAVAEVLKAARV
ncbi:copper homeostasis protein CutC [Mucilaginibacter ginkgonis]|uniref:PF03932 family protein CutC n=1 Tax=Mucilaginibacter ginkgonis TaxID=2682091 RepID=A0A6I4I2U9_9SPHI|nr:copper homeostasis protein CutC [Mucilaginibacter ginkgonis]QQL50645.1 copper homeostasis protein CutC [Mucilaginibacter ginkgonis]